MSDSLAQLQLKVEQLTRIITDNLGVTPAQVLGIKRTDGIRMQPVMSERAWNRTADTLGDDLDYDIAADLNHLGIPYPCRKGNMSWPAYESPTPIMEKLRKQLQYDFEKITTRGMAVVPMEYHHVIKGVVADAISDAVCDTGTICKIQGYGDEMWGAHLNLWNTQVTNCINSDDRANENSMEAREEIVEGLIQAGHASLQSTIRKEDLIDKAILNTVRTIEDSIVEGRISNMVGLTAEFASTWAHTVNS